MKEDKELQARDRLLNLFVDGEMTSDKASDYRNEVLNNDPQAQQDHQMLLGIRREIRTHNAEQTAQILSNVKSEQLWQRIEAEIQREVVVEIPWWRNFSIPAFGLATACAIFAFVIGVQFGSSPVKRDTVINVGNQLAANNSGNANFTNVKYGSDLNKNNNFQFELKANGNKHEIIVAANQDGVLHRVPIELDSNQLIGVNQGFSMRAQNVDIDWIKSDRQYRLVPSGKSVPVIWVTGNK